MKVRAFITASVTDGPWATVPLTFNTNDIIMRLVFGDEAEPWLVYETADPEFRGHLEAIYAAIGSHALRQSVSLSAD